MNVSATRVTILLLPLLLTGGCQKKEDPVRAGDFFTGSLDLPAIVEECSPEECDWGSIVVGTTGTGAEVTVKFRGTFNCKPELVSDLLKCLMDSLQDLLTKSNMRVFDSISSFNSSDPQGFRMEYWYLKDKRLRGIIRTKIEANSNDAYHRSSKDVLERFPQKLTIEIEEFATIN